MTTLHNLNIAIKILKKYCNRNTYNIKDVFIKFEDIDFSILKMEILLSNVIRNVECNCKFI